MVIRVTAVENSHLLQYNPIGLEAVYFHVSLPSSLLGMAYDQWHGSGLGALWLDRHSATWLAA